MLDATIQSTRQQMTDSLDALNQQLAKVNTGRANPAMIADILVDYYGSKVPIKQVANISVPEANQLLIQPWDKSAITPIEKAVRETNIGLNPQMDGATLRIVIPSLTAERRREMQKVIADYTERCRVALRNHRHDALKIVKAAEQDKSISEDDSRRYQAKLQDITDDFNQQVEALHEAKSKDIMTL